MLISFPPQIFGRFLSVLVTLTALCEDPTCLVQDTNDIGVHFNHGMLKAWVLE